jgi:hemerythrin superfamily protein
MDPFELLKADHETVSKLFTKIEASTTQSKRDLFTQLKTELDLHAHIEETIFYPALEKKHKARDITLEAYEEHKVVKKLLAELADEPHSDEWDAKLTVLKESVEHHVQEEESELFERAEETLSSEQLAQLGDRLEAEKVRRSSSGAKKAPVKTAAKRKRVGLLGTMAKMVGLGAASSEATRKVGKGKRSQTRSSKGSATTSKRDKKAPAKKLSKKTQASATAGKKSSSGAARRRGHGRGKS